MGLGVFLDTQERGRDHVEAAGLGKGEATLKMVGLPPIVIVEDRDVEPPGVAVDSEQMVEARVPRSASAPSAAVAKEVHNDAGRLPRSNRLFGSPRGDIVG